MYIAETLYGAFTANSEFHLVAVELDNYKDLCVGMIAFCRISKQKLQLQQVIMQSVNYQIRTVS